MPPTNEPGFAPLAPEWEACLLRTRASVLNVLVGDGVLIAVSGWLLRHHRERSVIRPARGWHDGLLLGLIVVAACSYWLRRPRLRRSGDETASLCATRFFRSHVGSAAVAAIGVPLGLLYGWSVDPRLQGVIVFWVVPLALGLLALPRRGEFDEVSPPSPAPEAHTT